MDKKYFTTRQVAQQLKFSEVTVRNYCFCGRIKAEKFGNQFAITQESIDAFKKMTGRV
jgi:excisionase family DNA binding protein